MSDTYALTIQTRSYTHSKLYEDMGRLAKQWETAHDRQMAVGVCTNELYAFVISVLSVLQNKGVVLPLEPGDSQRRTEHLLIKNQAELLLTDHYESAFVRTVNIADRIQMTTKTVPIAINTADLHMLANESLFDEQKISLPGIFAKWFSFCTEILGVNFQESFYIYEEMRDVFHLSWLPILLSGNTIHFQTLDSELFTSDSFTNSGCALIPLHLLPRFAEGLRASGTRPPSVILSFGRELISSKQEKEYFTAMGTKWYNFYGFPHLPFVTSITGEGTYEMPYAHQGKPMTEWPAYVLNEHLLLQPYRIPGEIFLSIEANDVVDVSSEKNPDPYRPDAFLYQTGLQGVRHQDGIIRMSPTNEQLNQSGVCIHCRDVEIVLQSVSSITDCGVHIANDCLQIYYQSNQPLAVEDLDTLLQRWFPIEKFTIKWFPVARIPRGGDNQLDLALLARMKPINSAEAASIQQNLAAEQIDTAVLFSYSPVQKEIAVQPLPIKQPVRSREHAEVLTSAKAIIQQEEILPEREASLTLPDLLNRAAKSNKQLLFLAEDGRETSLTYTELWKKAQRIACSLIDKGLPERSKVLFQVEEPMDFILMFWGTILAGMVPVAMPAASGQGEKNSASDRMYESWRLLDKPIIATCCKVLPILEAVRHQYDDLSSAQLITVQELIQRDPEERILMRREEWRPEETVLLMFTSGSSGKPKGVMLTHRNLVARSYGSMVFNGFGSEEMTLNWMPFSHVGGLIYFHVRDVYLTCNQLQVAAPYVLGDPTRWLNLIDRHRVTLTWAPHFAFSLINEQANELSGRDWDLTCLHSLLNGAEHISWKDLQTFARLLEPYGLTSDSLKPVFGMSETSSGITYSRGFDTKRCPDVSGIVPVGHPIPGVSIRIVNEEGNIAEEGAVGGLQIRGVTLMAGYYKNEQATLDSFTADGWFITGDLAWIRERELYIAGREKEMVSVQGVNYYCQEVEESVMDSEVVKATCCAVCAVRTNEAEGEKLAVFYTPRKTETLDLQEEKQFADFASQIRRKLIERFGIRPDFVIPLKEKEFPRSDIGKIQRSKLKTAFESGQFAARLQSRGFDDRYFIPDWFYQKEWRLSLRQQSLLVAPKKTVLVIGEQNQLQSLFAVLPHGSIRYIPVSLPDAAAWLDSPVEEIDEILDLTHLYQEKVGKLPSYESITSTLERFQVLSRSIIRASKQRSIGYTVVTRNAFSVKENDWLSSSAILPGLAKCLSLEATGLQVRMIDLDTAQPEKYREELARELLSSTSSFSIAYRNGVRYDQCLVSCEPMKDSQMPRFLQNDGWVLVTGGLGDVGLHVCRWLLNHFNVKLAVIGTTERKESLEQLRSLDPEVLFFQGSVCDSGFLHEAIKKAESTFSRPLRAIFHLAGQLSQPTAEGKTHWQEMEKHLLEQETKQSYDAVLQSKVQGLLKLHEIRKDNPEIALIVFSSVIGHFGGVSLSAYAAANHFVDSYCEAISSEFPNTYCFSWSMWEQTGMSALVPEQVNQLSKRNGFVPLTTEKALLSMQSALQQRLHSCYIGLDPEGESMRGELWTEWQPRADIYAACPELDRTSLIEEKVEQMVQQVGWNPEMVRLHLVESIPRRSNHAEQIDVQRLLRMDRLQSKESLERNLSPRERMLLDVWKRVLELDELQINENFFDAGGSSVVMTKLLYEIRQQCGVQLSFRDLLEAPTISLLAARMEGGSEERKEEASDIQRLYSEVEQVASCLPKQLPPDTSSPIPSRILLTGATGFIGEYLLNALVKHSETTVYCLVRADSEEQATERIRKLLEPYSLSQWLGSRVIPLVGDLERERFGWREEDYHKWSEEIDTILHNGAFVNFALPYSRLKACNVNGTAELIAFALCGKKKTFHHISTLSIFDSLPDGTTVDEGHTADLMKLLQNGYNQSKWVADRLVQQAFLAGLSGSLFRIGTTLGDTLTGKCHTQEFVSLALKGCIEMGVYPDIAYPLNILPVDQLAFAVVQLVLHYDGTNGEVYHLHPEKPLMVNQLMEWATHAGYPLKPLPYKEWLHALAEQIRQSPDPFWSGLYGLFPQGEGVFSQIPHVDFTAEKTNRILSAHGAQIEKFSHHNLIRMLEYFGQIGFMSTKGKTFQEAGEV
ncbi:thioester reductase domain-containing protein [Brevibacillus porteri]|uniref:Carrier domain-containing protein n=1 Tax=Brevibacillus porteri TaxID=2126350 RepID=A0ABX5FVH5_9BACL|nr:thioester reductase domain-containing protein [Brevibacillus porteri]MED1798844.1 thioester reductase domain-containing protein [Brevibacillus porteri]MED2131527.1 thioester reductase domain-containing protein [Brevibacillus porteri]MED2744080.1 thioester reductase domain-containing protein [Brevibacillus porteri]MED2813294.1 thioester reductase domain-containing protein [Brevibacillus porteri]MED2896612.1 thioester reductase domain-containing protein [Brevibacillus porteri]